MKIRPMGAELLHMEGRADGWTQRHVEAHGRFPLFAKVPNNQLVNAP
jgi:hypothetical protein